MIHSTDRQTDRQTDICICTLAPVGAKKITYPDGESFPLTGASSVVLDVEEGLVPLVDHQTDGVGETVTGAALVPARVNNITLGLNLGGNYVITFLLLS